MKEFEPLVVLKGLFTLRVRQNTGQCTLIQNGLLRSTIIHAYGGFPNFGHAVSS